MVDLSGGRSESALLFYGGLRDESIQGPSVRDGRASVATEIDGKRSDAQCWEGVGGKERID